MAKKKKKMVEVLIEEMDFPNRTSGCILEGAPFDPIDHMLEIEPDRRKLAHGAPIITKGGIPGQIWHAQVKRTRGEKKEVILRKLLERSPLEKHWGCPNVERCGGCTYQTLSYDMEHFFKGAQMKKLYEEAGITNMVPLRRSPIHTGYRNKMEYSFGDQVQDGELTLGLHRPGRFYEIVPTPRCRIVPEDFNRIRAEVEAFGRESGLSYYHKGRHSGFLRHLVVRASLTARQLMVNLVTTSDDDMQAKDWKLFIARLRALPLEFSLVSVFHTTNDSVSDAVIPEKLELLYGQDYLEEKLFDLTFRVGPFSFFQPNVPGAENLYARAVELAGDLQGKTVYDLYSGTGTLAQIMAKHAQRVVGVEIVEEAVEHARKSAELNHLPNCSFRAADVYEELTRLAETRDYPDVVMLDPPREGVNPKAIEHILAAKPERIVYISCNPLTHVRDLRFFRQGGYQVKSVEAFDQFPRTKHVETVVLMSRVEGK